MDIWTYDPETRRITDGNGLKVAADVVPEDALIILSMQAALIDLSREKKRHIAVFDGIIDMAQAALDGTYQSRLIDSGPPDTHWEAHTGEDYSVVMAIDEGTDEASVRVYGEDPAGLAQRIANALNRSHRAEVEPVVLRIEIVDGTVSDFVCAVPLPGLTIQTIDYDTDGIERDRLTMVDQQQQYASGDRWWRDAYIRDHAAVTVRAAPETLPATDAQFDDHFDA